MDNEMRLLTKLLEAINTCVFFCNKNNPVTRFLLYTPRGICTQAPCYCIIMEYCAQGQLYEVLRAGRKIHPSLLMDWAMGIAGGMNYLHLHKIIHRDLKSPKYVFVDLGSKSWPE